MELPKAISQSASFNGPLSLSEITLSVGLVYESWIVDQLLELSRILKLPTLEAVACLYYISKLSSHEFLDLFWKQDSCQLCQGHTRVCRTKWWQNELNLMLLSLKSSSFGRVPSLSVITTHLHTQSHAWQPLIPLKVSACLFLQNNVSHCWDKSSWS